MALASSGSATPLTVTISLAPSITPATVIDSSAISSSDKSLTPAFRSATAIAPEPSVKVAAKSRSVSATLAAEFKSTNGG